MAGFARFKYTRRMISRRLLAAGVIVVLIAVAVAVRGALKARSAHSAALSPPAPLSYEAKQAVDVHLVGGAVSQYASANAALPAHLSVALDGGLVLCGAVCNPALYELTGFSVYQAANIRLVGYQAELKAPNANTMYLVPGAKCGGGGRVGDPSPAQRSMVILYVGGQDDKATPRCVVL